jgi:hypothetical protein
VANAAADCGTLGLAAASTTVEELESSPCSEKRSNPRIRHASQRKRACHGESIPKNSSWKTKRRFVVKSKIYGCRPSRIDSAGARQSHRPMDRLGRATESTTRVRTVGIRKPPIHSGPNPSFGCVIVANQPNRMFLMSFDDVVLKSTGRARSAQTVGSPGAIPHHNSHIVDTAPSRFSSGSSRSMPSSTGTIGLKPKSPWARPTIRLH